MYIIYRTPSGLLKIPLYTSKSAGVVTPNAFRAFRVSGQLFYMYLFNDASLAVKCGSYRFVQRVGGVLRYAGAALAVSETTITTAGTRYVSSYTDIVANGYPKIAGSVTHATAGQGGAGGGGGGGNGGARTTLKTGTITFYISGGGGGAGQGGPGCSVPDRAQLSSDRSLALSDSLTVSIGGGGYGGGVAPRLNYGGAGSPGNASSIAVNGVTILTASPSNKHVTALNNPGSSGGTPAGGVAGSNGSGYGVGHHGTAGTQRTGSYPAGGPGGAGVSGGGGTGGSGGTGAGSSSASGGYGTDGGSGWTGAGGSVYLVLRYLTRLAPA